MEEASHFVENLNLVSTVPALPGRTAAGGAGSCPHGKSGSAQGEPTLVRFQGEEPGDRVTPPKGTTTNDTYSSQSTQQGTPLALIMWHSNSPHRASEEKPNYFSKSKVFHHFILSTSEEGDMKPLPIALFVLRPLWFISISQHGRSRQLFLVSVLVTLTFSCIMSKRGISSYDREIELLQVQYPLHHRSRASNQIGGSRCEGIRSFLPSSPQALVSAGRPSKIASSLPAARIYHLMEENKYGVFGGSIGQRRRKGHCVNSFAAATTTTSSCLRMLPLGGRGDNLKRRRTAHIIIVRSDAVPKNERDKNEDDDDDDTTTFSEDEEIEIIDDDDDYEEDDEEIIELGSALDDDADVIVGKSSKAMSDLSDDELKALGIDLNKRTQDEDEEDDNEKIDPRYKLDDVLEGFDMFKDDAIDEETERLLAPDPDIDSAPPVPEGCMRQVRSIESPLEWHLEQYDDGKDDDMVIRISQIIPEEGRVTMINLRDRSLQEIGRAIASHPIGVPVTVEVQRCWTKDDRKKIMPEWRWALDAKRYCYYPPSSFNIHTNQHFFPWFLSPDESQDVVVVFKIIWDFSTFAGNTTDPIPEWNYGVSPSKERIQEFESREAERREIMNSDESPILQSWSEYGIDLSDPRNNNTTHLFQREVPEEDDDVDVEQEIADAMRVALQSDEEDEDEGA
eukprot:jgi/Bigna1/70942/fgenesh1_pg.13_\